MQAEEGYFGCPVGLRNAKFHPNEVIPHEFLPLSWKWKKFMRSEARPVEFSILRSAGHQKYICFACVPYGFAARGGKGIHLD